MLLNIKFIVFGLMKANELCLNVKCDLTFDPVVILSRDLRSHELLAQRGAN